MKNRDNFTEAPYDEFDAPIPGQSLTDTPGNAPWEHPPQYTNPEEILDGLYDKITDGEFSQQLIAMLDAGVPVEAIVRVMVFGGFMQGKFTPDVGFMIVEPLMKLVSAIGIRAGVKELRLSLDDLSNNKFLISFRSANFVCLSSGRGCTVIPSAPYRIHFLHIFIFDTI